ncbi:SCO family protein [Maritimibacter sp. DP1N21-5]|uniref:SCO family protein n=1 Tax=Maritimibacter sp. DP1N21-5 TaxID=2836867 RepID=UPI001C47BE9A|nr:SCO family protein [Maritimibacter sp. DP1N21-5]MBV7410978.1 SCO family protein [Maritimibacter sp. DP1N21-5]
MTRTIALGGVALLALVIGGTAVYVVANQSDDQFAACRGSAVATGPGSIGGPFTLVSEDGETVTDQDVFTKPTLLYFGYTFCPDVCPLDNARNAEALDLLQEQGRDAQMAMISIDPERDTPEQMKDFTSYLHDDMIGLTGSPEQVRAASQAYKTYYRKQEGDPEYYLVDHSTFTYLVLPEVGFVEFFKRDDSAEKIAETTSCFIDASS